MHIAAKIKNKTKMNQILKRLMKKKTNIINTQKNAKKKKIKKTILSLLSIH